ncbi:MAG: TonB-dependent receptor [Halothiobacillaceae bacterium]|nr:TonB-dependent receptor [Halothiobacillaceae bacterium]
MSPPSSLLMRHGRFALLLPLWLAATAVVGEERLPEVRVDAGGLSGGEDLRETASVTHLDGASAREAAGPAAASPFKAIENTPSINLQGADPYGLTEVGFHETLKIRGVGQTGPASSRNVDELPITGNPGGSKGILDMENVAEVSVYRGAAPVDKALGFSNLPGKINLVPLAPAFQARTRYALGGGSDGFGRVFLRQDTGRLGAFSGFVSGSYTLGDKWKGEGDFTRKNLLAGLSLDGGARWQARLYAGFNKDARHTYRFFNYAQASDFSNVNRDWGTDPKKVDYYDYNRQDFDDRFVWASLRGRLTDRLSLTLKPYYLNESGSYRFSSLNAQDPTKSRVIHWMIDHENLGLLSRLDWQLDTRQALQGGLWVHSQQPPGPPVTQQKYRVSASGLAFDGWTVLADHERHRILSPFLTYLAQFDALNLDVGLRYVNLRLGALTAYNNGGAAAGVSDPDAARTAGGVDAMASAPARTLNEWLPYLGLAYSLDARTSVYTRMGRSYGLDVNLFPYYYAQKAQFVKNGVSFQSLWNRLELETADNIDLGLRHAGAGWSAGATVFYALHRNKQSTVYDPAVGLRYPWNSADARRYGIELEGQVALGEAFSVYGNYSWNRFRYSEDLLLSSSASIPSAGKQVVDTPEHMLKLGARYRQGSWNLGLDARYLGPRYGDVLNLERVGSVVLVDARAEYHLSRALAITLDVRNLFDREYIGPINAADDAIANFTAALNGVTGNGSSYQYGAPRSVFVGIAGEF